MNHGMKTLWGRFGRLREGLRDPWHSFREFHRVWMLCNRGYGLLQEVCRGSSTGSSELLQEVLLFLQEALKPGFKQWESEQKVAWMARGMVEEVVMAQQQ